MKLIGLLNTADQAIEIDGLVNFGQVYRRFDKKESCGCRAFETTGESLTLQQQGVYKITITATISAPAAGTFTLQVLENGVLLNGIEASETITTATTELRNITIDYITYVSNGCLMGFNTTQIKTISLQNTSGAAMTVNNIVVNAVKY